MNKPTALLTIVGCGPGGEDYVTPAAKAAVRQATTLVGAPRLLAMFPDADVEKIPVTSPLSRVLDTIADKAAAGGQVAVLVTGDPGLRSLARPVLERMGREQCRIIPGVSSVQAAFAGLALPWENAHIVSAHHSRPEIDHESLVDRDTIAVLLGADDAMDWTAEQARRLPGHRCFVCENLTLPREHIHEENADTLRTLQPAGRSVVVFARKELMQ